MPWLRGSLVRSQEVSTNQPLPHLHYNLKDSQCHSLKDEYWVSAMCWAQRRMRTPLYLDFLHPNSPEIIPA